MRRMALAILVLLLMGPSLAFGADAVATASPHVSYSIWGVDGATVRVRVMIPTSAARNLAGANAPPPGLATVASAVSKGMTVTTPAGDCEAVDQGEGVGQIYTLALTPGLDRFEILFTCPQAQGLVLKDSLLFDRDPGHIDYAQIRVGAGVPALQAFTRDRQAIALPASGATLRDADPIAFARAAAIRLVGGLIALALILGSVLLSRRWLDLAWLAATVSLGYLASLAVSLSGLVTLDQSLTEPLTGLLIAILGLGALQAASGATGFNKPWRRVAWVGLGLVLAGLIAVATIKAPAAGLATGGVAAFGLGAVWAARAEPKLGALAFAPAAAFAFLKGLMSASDLSPLHPHARQLAPILVGQDLGGLAALVACAALAMGLIWLAGLRLRAWRDTGSELGGAALIGLGLFWFVSRLYS